MDAALLENGLGLTVRPSEAVEVDLEVSSDDSCCHSFRRTPPVLLLLYCTPAITVAAVAVHSQPFLISKRRSKDFVRCFPKRK
jgi:hypothetical protein